MTQNQKELLMDILLQMKGTDIEFHHGDRFGSDVDAHEIAREMKVSKVVIHPPILRSEQAFCLADEVVPISMDRLRDIVDTCEVVIASPHKDEKRTTGTWQYILYGQSIGKAVRVLKP
jgi:hypothetical protein